MSIFRKKLYHSINNWLSSKKECIWCKVLKPDGQPATEQLSIKVYGEKETTSAISLPKFGRYPFPAVHDDSFDCLYCIGKSGWFITRNPMEIIDKSVIQLQAGGRIIIYWNKLLPVFTIALANSLLPEIEEGVIVSDKLIEYQIEQPPGDFIVKFYFKSCREGYPLQCYRWGNLNPDETCVVNLGNNLKHYRIQCNFVGDFSLDQKFSILLRSSADFTLPSVKFLEFAPAMIGAKTTENRVLSSFEEWYYGDFSASALKDFNIIADKCCRYLLLVDDRRLFARIDLASYAEEDFIVMVRIGK